MRKTLLMLLTVVIPIALLTLVGCATKNSLQPVVLLDGRHVTSFKAGDHIDMIAPTLSGVSSVFVVTDVGMKLMYGLDVTPVKE